MKYFPKKIPIGINKWWIGFTDDGRPLYESRFYANGKLQRRSRYPNTTTDFAPSIDGQWTSEEDGLGGMTCTLAEDTPTTEVIGDDHALDPAQYYDSGLDFDTSTIPDTDTITSATLKIYRNSFSKSKSLDTNYVVNYYSKQAAFASPMVCADKLNFSTSEGSGNWANTTGYFSKSIATTSINVSGHTSFLLQPAWAHVGTPLFKKATWRTVDYSGTTSDPVLTVVHAGAITFIPRMTLLGAG